jgi:hypothetical protein
VAKFLQLHGEGAAALNRDGKKKLGADVKQPGLEQPFPFYGRVLPRRARTAEIAVFQKKQSLDQQWRNVVNFFEEKLRLRVPKQGRAVETANIDARPGPFVVGRRNAAADQIEQRFGLARLLR